MGDREIFIFLLTVICLKDSALGAEETLGVMAKAATVDPDPLLARIPEKLSQSARIEFLRAEVVKFYRWAAYGSTKPDWA